MWHTISTKHVPFVHCPSPHKGNSSLYTVFLVLGARGSPMNDQDDIGPHKDKLRFFFKNMPRNPHTSRFLHNLLTCPYLPTYHTCWCNLFRQHFLEHQTLAEQSLKGHSQRNVISANYHSLPFPPNCSRTFLTMKNGRKHLYLPTWKCIEWFSCAAWLVQLSPIVWLSSKPIWNFLLTLDFMPLAIGCK
jgi:hypothetical protein